MNAITTVLYPLADVVGGHGHGFGHGHHGAAMTTSSSPSGGWIAFAAAILAAILTGFLNSVLARRKSSEEARSRIRTVFAEALEAVAAYKEFPYAIRRRNGEEPGKERVRLSEELRNVQIRLTYYSTWIHAESKIVGKAYGDLVTVLRRVAGGACHDAWLSEPITGDAEMNIGPDVVDLSELTPLEAAYAAAADKYLNEYVQPLWKFWRNQPTQASP